MNVLNINNSVYQNYGTMNRSSKMGERHHAKIAEDGTKSEFDKSIEKTISLGITFADSINSTIGMALTYADSMKAMIPSQKVDFYV